MGRKTEGDQRLADIFAKHMVGLVLKSFSHPLSVCVPLKSIIFLSHSYSSYQHQRLPSTSILFWSIWNPPSKWKSCQPSTRLSSACATLASRDFQRDNPPLMLSRFLPSSTSYIAHTPIPQWHSFPFPFTRFQIPQNKTNSKCSSKCSNIPYLD